MQDPAKSNAGASAGSGDGQQAVEVQSADSAPVTIQVEPAPGSGVEVTQGADAALAVEAPAWLPPQLEGAWEFLANYPPVLSLAIALAGIMLAVLGRWFVLFWGRKLTSRTRSSLDEQLLGIVANAAAMILAYLAIVLAIQVLGLGRMAELILTRIALTLLVLRLIVSALKAGHVGLEIVGRLGKRFAIVEARTMPLFDLIVTVLV